MYLLFLGSEEGMKGDRVEGRKREKGRGRDPPWLGTSPQLGCFPLTRGGARHLLLARGLLWPTEPPRQRNRTHLERKNQANTRYCWGAQCWLWTGTKPVKHWPQLVLWSPWLACFRICSYYLNTFPAERKNTVDVTRLKRASTETDWGARRTRKDRRLQ